MYFLSFIDLYIANYGPNLLLKNSGDGTFTDVTHLAGVGDARWSRSGVSFDADGDALNILVIVSASREKLPA